MSYYPEFARLLNQALQRHERSASWLAQRLGVSPSTVGRWLNDGTRPGTPEMVGQIADILGMTATKPALLPSAGYGYVSATPGEAATPKRQQCGDDRAHVRTPKLPSARHAAGGPRGGKSSTRGLAR